MTHDTLTMMRTGEHERPPKATELVLVDIDRTLIRTRALFESAVTALGGAIEGVGGLTAELYEVEAKEKGNAFDYLEWLYARVGDERLRNAEAIMSILMEMHAGTDGRFDQKFIDSVMIEGAFDLFTAIKDTKQALILLTAGGTVNQMVKVLLLQEISREQQARENERGSGRRYASLDSFMIIDNNKQYKAKLASKCVDERDSSFDIEPLVAHASLYGGIDGDSYTDIAMTWVVDDKLVNTTPSNSEVEGVLVYIEGDPSKREADEPVEDPYKRVSLQNVATFLREQS